MIPINTGDQFITRTDSLTTPFPKISKRITKREKAKLNDWLKTNAALEAERQGNDFAKRMFEHLDVNNWSPADGDGVHQYLFGDKYINGRIGDLKHIKEIIVSELQLNDDAITTNNTKVINTVELDPLIAWAFT